MKNNNDEINDFLKTLSNQRFERYLLMAQHDMQKAMEYRSEVFNKTGKVYDIQQGYKVIYPDGYVNK